MSFLISFYITYGLTTYLVISSVLTRRRHCGIAALFGEWRTIISQEAKKKERQKERKKGREENVLRTYIFLYNISQNLIGYGLFRNHPEHLLSKFVWGIS